MSTLRGGTRTISYFLKLLNKTADLTDNVLPDLLLDLDKDVLDELVSSCENAKMHLQVFSKLCTLVQKSKAKQGDHEKSVNSSLNSTYLSIDSQYSKSSRDLEDATPFSCQMSELTELMKETSSLRDFSTTEVPIELYICAPCNFRTFSQTIWSNHGESRAHMMTSSRTAVLTFCNVCNLHLYGSADWAKAVFESSEHHHMDKQVRELNRNCVKPQEPQKPAENPTSPPPSTECTKTNHLEHQNPPDKVVLRLMESICELLAQGTPFFRSYCQICNVESRRWQNHREHASGKQHSNRISLSPKKSASFVCSECNFVIISSMDFGVCSMTYHYEKCHGPLKRSQKVWKTGNPILPKSPVCISVEK